MDDLRLRVRAFTEGRCVSEFRWPVLSVQSSTLALEA